MFFSSTIYSQVDSDNQNDGFRAMWIFNIAENVIWPNEDTISTFTIGVLSRSSSVYDELVILNKTIKNKPVKIIHFNRVKQIVPTNILYLGFDKNIDIFRVNDIIKNTNTLLITDRIDEADNFMVNILPFDKGSKRIEIDKMNIESHNLTVTQQLLYNGGSEEELKDMYAKQRKELDLQKAEVDKKKAEVLELQKDLSEQKQRLDEQKAEIQKQKNKLEQMSAKMMIQQKALTNNDELLSKQENLILAKQNEVKEKIKELESQEDILEKKNNDIIAKQDELKNLEDQIENAKTDLSSANDKIETQKGMLLIGAIFIGVILIFSIFLWQALQKNSRMNKELTKKNTEINKQKNRIEIQANLLEQSNKELEKLSIVAENAQNGITIMDNKGDIIWINAGFTKMYGYTLQLLINEKDINVIEASNNPEIKDLIQKCIDKKINVTYESESIKRNNEIIWVKTTITPILNEKDEVEKLVAIDTDITEIKKAEHKITKQAEALEISNKELEKLSIVVRETDNAILITDAEGNLEWVNTSFTETFGFTLEEFKAKVSKNIVSHSTQKIVKDKIDILYRTKKPVTYQLATHNKAGEKIWLQANVSPILDENNNIKNLVLVDSDITAVKEAEQQIIEKNHELTTQKERIELQNSKIRASIQYAKTIQQAILPLKNILSEHFESEIIFRPKDVVSGDFYWFYHNSNKNNSFVATVDCTGHGVPGAFMSLISSRILNDIVSNSNDIKPHDLLEQTDNQIKIALRQNHTNNNDGLDIALCKIERNGDEINILFAGAKRNLYFYDSKIDAVNTLRGTRRSIGGIKKTVKKQIFTTSEAVLHKGDVLYLMTDGFIDQNNKKRKKYGTKKLINLLESIRKKDITTQKNIIETDLLQHMSQTEQRDDITVWLIKL